MEDFFKFLIVAGVIVVGIYNEVKKNRATKAKNKRPATPIPQHDEADYEPTPLPEAWGRGTTLDELFEPAPTEPPVRKPSAKPSYNKQPSKKKKQREEISVSASLANSVAQDERNSRQGTHYDTPNGSSDGNSEYEIHSAEDARKAIIWGEILRRKY